MSNPVVYFMSTEEMYSAENKYSSYLTQNLADTNSMSEVLNSFLSETGPVLTGQVWDIVRNDLHSYEDCLEYTAALNSVIEEANKEYFRQIQEFLQPDTNLNTADLPKFEREKTQLEADIKALQDENKELAKTPKTIEQFEGYDKDGNPIYKTVHNPQYDIDQAKIVENNTKIQTVLQPELNEKIRLINKINKFTGEILPKLNAQLDEVEQKLNEYIKLVDDAKDSLPKASTLASTSKRSYDLDTREGRFLYIYDQLTGKYGYSEWGAKAILAHIRKETADTFQSDIFQGQNGPNAGYGLIQWEYAKYGGWTNRAEDLEKWCGENGYDYKSLDGQLAYLDHDIKERAAGYNVSLYEDLKTATEDDYTTVGTQFGTYIEGITNSQNSWNRLHDGNLKYKLFPIIDNRDAYKTAPQSKTATLINLGRVESREASTPPTVSQTPIPTVPVSNYPPSSYAEPLSYTGPVNYNPPSSTVDNTSTNNNNSYVEQTPITETITPIENKPPVVETPPVTHYQEIISAPVNHYEEPVNLSNNSSGNSFVNTLQESTFTSMSNVPTQFGDTLPSTPEESTLNEGVPLGTSDYSYGLSSKPIPVADSKVIPNREAEVSVSKKFSPALVAGGLGVGAATAAIAYTMNKKQKAEDDEEEEEEGSVELLKNY